MAIGRHLGGKECLMERFELWITVFVSCCIAHWMLAEFIWPFRLELSAFESSTPLYIELTGQLRDGAGLVIGLLLAYFSVFPMFRKWHSAQLGRVYLAGSVVVMLSLSAPVVHCYHIYFMDAMREVDDPVASWTEKDRGFIERIHGKLGSGDRDSIFREVPGFLRRHPTSSAGWLLMGWAQLRFDRHVEGVWCMDRALLFHPRSDSAFCGKGFSHFRLGELVEAREDLEHALALQPKNVKVLYLLMMVDLRERRSSAAVDHGEQAWRMCKTQAIIPAELSVAYHHAGDREKRDECYLRAMRLGYSDLPRLRHIFSAPPGRPNPN